MKKELISENQIMELLNSLYEKSLNGLPKAGKPIPELADDYLSKNPDIKVACKKMINNQIKKCSTSGFLTGLGGLITLPAAIPADVGTSLYVQMRMIACIAYMGGYDLSSDQVRTLVYACLAGISIDKIVANGVTKFGEKLAVNMIKKIPGETLTKINQKVGQRFITKFGSKGIINLGKAVPLVGGVVGGGFNFAETRIIANRAYKMFIEGDIRVGE